MKTLKDLHDELIKFVGKKDAHFMLRVFYENLLKQPFKLWTDFENIKELREYVHSLNDTLKPFYTTNLVPYEVVDLMLKFSIKQLSKDQKHLLSLDEMFQVAKKKAINNYEQMELKDVQDKETENKHTDDTDFTD